MFDKITDVPAPIADCYYEEEVMEPTGNMIDKEVDSIDENGDPVKITIQVEEMAPVKYVRKLPAYWEDGGHIGPSNIAKWDFYSVYMGWLRSEPLPDSEGFDDAHAAWLAIEPAKVIVE